ncbi:hypothetical protein BKA70DRAFT_1207695 [Coprinopsis sp. MPI-PUGE-AT-0042]|nr:hypothetical protein BKA70DRAFT_1207695 [Coprinopsis sp. MPI-PUGE-AT-0042]
MSTSSSTRFHSNPDILAEICEFLSCDDDDYVRETPEIKASRTHLARLARTCTAYLEPALDRLWRSLDTLFPLLKTLPAFVKTASGTHVVRGNVTQAEWDRFDWYGRKVRRFTYTSDPVHLDIAMHVYFRLAQLRPSSQPLLPCLHQLRCPEISQNDFLISGVCLFFTPSLQSLEFGSITGVEDKLTGTFLFTIQMDGAQLENLVLKAKEAKEVSLTPETLDLILGFESLRSIELEKMGGIITTQWLQELGRKPRLEELTLDLTPTPTASTVATNPPTPLPEPALITEEIGFRNLKSLMLTANLPFTLSFLTHTTSTTIETVAAVTHADTPTDRSAFITLLTTRYSHSLKSLALVHTPGPADTDSEPDVPPLLQLADIGPLLQLGQLEEFRLEGYEMAQMNDASVVRLASAWPNIVKLLLPYVPGDTDPDTDDEGSSEARRPTVDSLRVLREMCPKLKHVRIPLDLLRIPLFVRPPPTLTPSPPSSVPSPSTPSSLGSSFPSPSSSPPSSPQLDTIPPPLPASSQPHSPIQNLHRLSPHGLEKLTIPNADDLDPHTRPDHSRAVLQLARHIDYFFPRVQKVVVTEHESRMGELEGEWSHLNDLVLSFQAVRADLVTEELYGW